jgi:hypothetical protein
VLAGLVVAWNDWRAGPARATAGCGSDEGRPAADRAADGGINRLKQWPGIATRFDQQAIHYRAGVVIVSLLWLAGAAGQAYWRRP